MTAQEARTFTDVARIVSRRFARTYQWTQPQELEQEAWVAMLEALPNYDAGQGELAPYLYRVAQRAVKALVWRLSAAANVPRSSATPDKIKRGRAVIDSEEQLGQLVACEQDVESALVDREAALRVSQVLAEYLADGREGEITRAVLVGEVSVADGAAALAIKPNALYVRTHRLRQRLAADVRLQEVR